MSSTRTASVLLWILAGVFLCLVPYGQRLMSDLYVFLGFFALALLFTSYWFPRTPLFVYMLWVLTGLSTFLIILGLRVPDPEGKALATALASILLCLLAPFLAASNVRRRPLLVISMLACVAIGVLYANALAYQAASTTDLDLLGPQSFSLLFGIPGLVAVLLRWRPGQNG